MSSTITVQSAQLSNAPRFALPIGNLFAAGIAHLAAWMRPREESPAESASRLRSLANQYGAEPSFAADLRAAADRYEQAHGIE
jgi:hypothetical protein